MQSLSLLFLSLWHRCVKKTRQSRVNNIFHIQQFSDFSLYDARVQYATSGSYTFNCDTFFNNIKEDFSEVERRMDELGGPMTFNHYPMGWAHAMDSPFQWTKQVASHYGGTRNPVVVHWPEGIKSKGEIRSQWRPESGPPGRDGAMVSAPPPWQPHK